MENQMVKSVHLKDHIGDKRNLAENTSLCQRKLIKNCLSSRNTDLSNFQTLTSTRRSEKWNQNNFFLCIVSAIPPISDLKPVAELDFDEYWNFVEKLVNMINKKAEIVMQFDMVDCHAVNIFEQHQLVNYLFVDEDLLSVANKKKVLVFYCEFSQQRAPNMYRFLRNLHRKSNQGCYPNLYYFEIYLLDRGYNCFYKQYKDYCEPPNYEPMVAESYKHELITYRQKQKLHYQLSNNEVL
ncbi:hypothetical protein Tsp_11429 [Trichinella spiralis]|uniref:hypothetical protein n=1 Tax=Trichinella spiralis TaxID=6334 RepID=UPI0001EFE93A|nr:hypothetical protein Tsp_11429 [Trichinella spiralis]